MIIRVTNMEAGMYCNEATTQLVEALSSFDHVNPKHQLLYWCIMQLTETSGEALIY